MSSTTSKSSDQTPKLPRQYRLPQLHDGLNACDGRGRFLRVREVDGEFWIDWDLMEGEGLRSRRFIDLCLLPELELERYGLGTLAADILNGVANEILRAIPDPNAAMEEANPYWKHETAWRHWASAPAGHMAGLPTTTA